MTTLPDSDFLIDSHVHFAWPISDESLMRDLNGEGAAMACLAALPTRRRLNPTLDILAEKTLHPDRLFAFGCLDASAYGQKKHLGKYFVQQVERMRAMGCDGLKMLEGKPTTRRDFPVPDFDDPVWEPFWDYAESTRLPILWHVNDPETFWDPSKLPPFARSCGWGYGKGDVDNEGQYRQIRNLLARHERLNVTFAHMFFLSAQLIRLTEWMERFPGMRVDLTPGIELYENLSVSPKDTRAFFDRFSSRIQYGTDIGGRAVLKGDVIDLNQRESMLRAKYCKAFLLDRASMGIRPDEDFLIGKEPFVLHGLGLAEEQRKQILGENFLAFVGRRTPVPVDMELCKKEYRKARRILRAYFVREDLPPDYRALEADGRVFGALG